MPTEMELAAWPEHAEDLEGVIFGQSALQFYKDSAVITTSGSDIDEINRLVASHPLNETKQSFNKEVCEKLWKALVPAGSGTILVADVKLELLRQVKLYIEHGIEVLRSHPSAQSADTSNEPSQDLAQQPVEDASHEPAQAGHEAPGTGEETEAQPETADAAAEEVPSSPRRQKRARSRSITSDSASRKKQKVDQKQQLEESDAGDNLQAKPDENENKAKSESPEIPQERDGPDSDSAKPRDNTQRSSSPDDTKIQPDVSDKASGEDPSKSDRPRGEHSPEPSAQSLRSSRRKLRATRSARSTPEAEAATESRSGTPESEARSTEEPPDHAASAQKPTNDEDTDRALNKRPGKSRDGAKEAEEPEDSRTEADSTSKRKRGVTFEENEDNSLEKFVTDLSKDSKLAAFEQTEQHLHPNIVAPTSLSTITSEVRKKKLQSIDVIEVELFKMLANSVMCGEYDTNAVKGPIKSVDSAVTRFRENTQTEDVGAPQPPAPQTKRRRKD